MSSELPMMYEAEMKTLSTCKESKYRSSYVLFLGAQVKDRDMEEQIPETSMDPGIGMLPQAKESPGSGFHARRRHKSADACSPVEESPPGSDRFVGGLGETILLSSEKSKEIKTVP